MKPQQAAQPRSSRNGFTRRKGEQETGNKSQPGKPNFKPTSVESPSRERLLYLTTCLIGQQVEVQVIDGSVFSGIFHATNALKDFALVLKLARVIKAGQKNIVDSVQKPLSKFLIIPAKYLVQIVAKGVHVTKYSLNNAVYHKDMSIDSSISKPQHGGFGRELKPWVPDDDDPEWPDLDNTFNRPCNRGWDQFKTNAALFGVKSTYNEELYTTKLDKGPHMREREREALRTAREIEGEERGIRNHDQFEQDEETTNSSVNRGGDDSGYDENQEIQASKSEESTPRSTRESGVPGLSSTYSMGSENPSLNPRAQEFRPHPDAKTGGPSPTPIRTEAAAAPAGTFYFYPAKVANGKPPGIPNVMYGPPLETPLPPLAYRYTMDELQRLLSQGRPVIYVPVPTYPPPAMPKKGRESWIVEEVGVKGGQPR